MVFNPTPPQKLAGMRIGSGNVGAMRQWNNSGGNGGHHPPPVEPPAEYPFFHGVEVLPKSALSGIVPAMEYLRRRRTSDDIQTGRLEKFHRGNCPPLQPFPGKSMLPNSMRRPAS